MLDAVGSDDGALARPTVTVAVSSRDLIGHGSRAGRPLPRHPSAPAPPGLAAYPPPSSNLPDPGARRRRGTARRPTAALVAAIGLASLVTVALLSTSLGGSAITDQVNTRLSSAGKKAAGYPAHG